MDSHGRRQKFTKLIMMSVYNAQERIVKEVTNWKGVVASPHRFGGTEFRLGRREIGHVHGDFQVDLPFPIRIRDLLIAEGRAERHHILPDSGLVTFRLKGASDVKRAVDLFMLSYELARQPK